MAAWSRGCWRDGGLDRPHRGQVLLVVVILLQRPLVRRRVLGADQRVRPAALFGPAAQVSAVVVDVVLDVAANLLPRREPVLSFVGVAEVLVHLRTFAALTGDRRLAAVVRGRLWLGGGERLQLLAARRHPRSQRQALPLHVLLDPRAKGQQCRDVLGEGVLLRVGQRSRDEAG